MRSFDCLLAICAGCSRRPGRCLAMTQRRMNDKLSFLKRRCDQIFMYVRCTGLKLRTAITFLESPFQVSYFVSRSLTQCLSWRLVGAKLRLLQAICAGCSRRPRPLLGHDTAAHERQVLFPKNGGATESLIK